MGKKLSSSPCVFVCVWVCARVHVYLLDEVSYQCVFSILVHFTKGEGYPFYSLISQENHHILSDLALLGM